MSAKKTPILDYPKQISGDPKGASGAAKLPFFALPFAVLAEDAVAHHEGALKYGRHNWRKNNVLASTYISAAMLATGASGYLCIPLRMRPISHQTRATTGRVAMAVRVPLLSPVTDCSG